MRSPTRIDRRRLLALGAAGAGALALGGCDRLSQSPWFLNILEGAESLTHAVQRAMLGRDALAREYAESEISSYFKPNGSTDPQSPDYRVHAEQGFVSATGEIMQLHVSMATRRSAPFPADRMARVEACAAAHAELPRPERAGRRIGIPR